MWCYSNTCANDGLIRLNKFVLLLLMDSIICFFISIRTPHATPPSDTQKLYNLKLNKASFWVLASRGCRVLVLARLLPHLGFWHRWMMVGCVTLCLWISRYCYLLSASKWNYILPWEFFLKIGCSHELKNIPTIICFVKMTLWLQCPMFSGTYVTCSCISLSLESLVVDFCLTTWPCFLYIDHDS